MNKKNIRNIAIVAHIDHGKTTLLDGFLRQSNVFRQNQDVPECVMDSDQQEKERKITIFAKHTAIHYNDHVIHIIDTPGHADFSGEVERILGMVDTVLLLVDAKEGPMPQTRFVLAKSLEMGLHPLVVLNKIDRPHADPDAALDKTFDLFTVLGATDEQLDFTYCYASGLHGYAIQNIGDTSDDMSPLLDLIIEKVPAPSGNVEEPFLLQVSNVYYDDYLGRQACGRVLQGKIRKGDPILHLPQAGGQKRTTITKIEGHLGLARVEKERAEAGEIVILSGVPDVNIGDTLSHPEHPNRCPALNVDEPTLAVDISVNNSPFVGRDGKHVTMNKLRDRLMREKRANISLRIEEDPNDTERIMVAGRGELHLAVMIEAMRREGYELSVSKPRVLFKKENGTLLEPIEKAFVQVPEEYSGTIIDDLSRRRGEMQHLETNEHGNTSIQFLIPTRGLMGYRNDFLTKTRGLGILTTLFEGYMPHRGEIPGRPRGVMVSICAGKSNGYASFTLQDRGTLFCSPGEEVYEGMIVGEHKRDNDLVVNITKAKQLTNVRASGTDENIVLTPPRTFILEEAIDYIEDDELIEVTPNAIRLRKKFLTENERKRHLRGLGQKKA